jgi:hypothetical protein
VTPSGTEVVSNGKFYSAGPAVGSYEVSLRAVQNVFGADVVSYIEHSVLQHAPNPVFGVGNPEKAAVPIWFIDKYLFLPTLPIYKFFGNRGRRLMRQQNISFISIKPDPGRRPNALKSNGELWPTKVRLALLLPLRHKQRV